MLKTLIPLTVLILQFYCKTVLSICATNNNCTCHVGPQGDYEIECPYDTDRRLILSVQPQKYIYVQCTLQTKPEDYLDLLPELKTHRFQQIVFKACPLDKNTTFQQIFNKLGVHEVNHVKFQSFGINAPSKLYRHQLHGLESVQRLELLQSNKQTEFADDLLADLTNLTYLNLVDNRLRTIKSDFFRENKNLIFLDLGNNDLVENLSANTFTSLKNLKQLNLWRVNLTHLYNHIFDNLIKLENLDLRQNNLKTLPNDVFTNLISLRVLSLDHNEFNELPTRLFVNNSNLESINLSFNSKKWQLPDSLLANLSKLKRVTMDSSQITNLPENLFWNSTALINISMADNLLENLPGDLFRDCRMLYSLDLSFNQLEHLPENLFFNLENLHDLQLEHNFLKKITSDIFSNLVELIHLNLANNFIRHIENNAFARNGKLETIKLSNNNVSFNWYSYSPFGNLKNLQKLNLANNSILKISEDWRISMPNLKQLNLSHNKVESIDFPSIQFVSNGITVDLQNNRIRTVNLRTAEFIARQQTGYDAISGRKSNTIVLLANNPIECDCDFYYLMRYFEDKLDPRVRAMVEISSNNLTCNNPEIYKGQNVLSLQSEQIVCPLLMCPDNCTCVVRYYDSSTIVDCSNRNLTKLPDQLPKLKQYSNIMLYADNNKLNNELVINKMTANKTGYFNLKELRLQNNNISKVNWLPPKLEKIELYSNNLQKIDVTMLKNLTKLQRISLYDNPWICACENLDLLTFIQDEYQKVPNIMNIYCNNNVSFAQMTSDDMCPFPTVAIVSLASFFVLFSVFVTMLLIFFYRNEEAIKVWLFAHNKCLWWITEEELDKNKKYDAFVSYAHQDEEFVVQQLIPNLEQKGDKRYKLCIHNRDWIAGEWILNQIARSVEDSRRTLVVLSPHFLDSVWGKMEFRSAHTIALKEGRARVIIIKYKDIGSYDKLDPELRSYLTMNTYIEWGDKNFWDKLRYALPHPPPLNKRAELILQRMRMTFGDKLEMVNTPTPITIAPPTSVQKQSAVVDNQNENKVVKVNAQEREMLSEIV